MSAFPMNQALLQKPPLEASKAVAEASISLVSAVLEGFYDGILLLTTQAECLHVNQRGRQLCRRLNPEKAVPPEVWFLCERLIEGRNLLPEQNFVISDVITTAEGSSISLRVQWIFLDGRGEACLLVRLEDQTQMARISALLESNQYNLTARETEVWLLRKANYSYEEIAKQLFIAINTVKRHLKSIYAKRKQVLEGLEA
ncbi:MAG TPA: LuxR C-terminal-related transcriptional regulator [Leptolyngbyaceae cyanobacterium]